MPLASSCCLLRWLTPPQLFSGNQLASMLLDLRACPSACQDPSLKGILEAPLHPQCPLPALPKLGSFPCGLSVPREHTLILMLGWKTKQNKNFVFKKGNRFFFKVTVLLKKRCVSGGWSLTLQGQESGFLAGVGTVRSQPPQGSEVWERVWDFLLLIDG